MREGGGGEGRGVAEGSGRSEGLGVGVGEGWGCERSGGVGAAVAYEGWGEGWVRVGREGCRWWHGAKTA